MAGSSRAYAANTVSIVLRLLGILTVIFASTGACHAAQLLNTISGGCIEVQGGNIADGTPIDVYQCTGSPNQNWTISGGRITGIGGSCLDENLGAASARAPVILVSCNGRPSQKWTVSNGQIIGVSGQCLEAVGSDASNGIPLILSRCTAAASQKWLVQ
jgi:hypothetical protein